MKKILAMARKEMRHILRDPRSLMVAILMPVGMLLLFGYAIDMNLKDLPVAVLDQDRSPSSREFIREMTAGDFIVEAGRLVSRDQVETGFRRGEYRAALIIPPDYGEQLLAGQDAQVQLIVDGADASTASSVNAYLEAVVARINGKLRADSSIPAQPPLDARVRFLYNPELASAHFIVPGLTAVVMMMICSLLTSIAIAREKETGTLEQILTTPVKAAHVIVGKTLPYLAIAAFDAALILALGRIVFGVPMVGNWLVLAGYSIIYLLIALALGLLVSAVAKTQQVAMMLALMLTLLPALLLSGFIFPLSSMPTVLQWVGHIIPATYYLRVIRGVMMAGTSWFPVETVVMIGMMLLLMTAAVRKFSSRLE